MTLIERVRVVILLAVVFLIMQFPSFDDKDQWELGYAIQEMGSIPLCTRW